MPGRRQAAHWRINPEPYFFVIQADGFGCIASMQGLSMKVALALPIIRSGQIARSPNDIGQFSEPPDSAHSRQRFHVWRGTVAVGAQRPKQWREATDRNHWRRPYRQHHRRALDQERAQGIVFIAPS